MKRSHGYAGLWRWLTVGLLMGMLGGCALLPRTEAVIDLSSTQGTVPLTVAFDASQSSAPDGIASYRWAFGDGVETYAVSGQHTFNRAGRYEVELTVHSKGGDPATQRVTVDVGPAFWVADENLNEIYKLDADGNAILTLTSPVSRPRGLAIVLRNNDWVLYVACEGDGAPRLVVLEASTGEQIAQYLAPGQDPGGMTYAPSYPVRLWHVGKMSRRIFEINPADGMNLNSFGATYFQSSPNLGDAPFLQTPQGIAWKEGPKDPGSLWVLEAETRLLYELEIVAPANIFDATQLALQANPISLSASLFPITGLDWHDGYLWVVERHRRQVTQVDPQTGSPTGLALTGFPGSAVTGLCIQK